jgi:two-component system response regulator
MNKGERRIHILLVEDNPDDVLLTKLAFEEINTNDGMRIHVVEDGEEALRFLKREGKYKQSPRPRLILLDLNLPKIPGIEVLEQIKQDSHLKKIPVAVLTTSTYEEDILKSYQRHANCYITKPMDLEAFVEVAKTLQHFWFSVVTLPQEE